MSPPVRLQAVANPKIGRTANSLENIFFMDFAVAVFLVRKGGGPLRCWRLLGLCFVILFLPMLAWYGLEEIKSDRRLLPLDNIVHQEWGGNLELSIM